MTKLIIDNYSIEASIFDILTELKDELANGKLSCVEMKGEYVKVTCPFHSDGLEHKASCSVYCGDGELEYGWYHCFTCSESGPFYKFIAGCKNCSYDSAKEWLISKYGRVVDAKTLMLDPIQIKKDVVKKEALDESVLANFESYHPYMTKRKISDDIIKKFDIKYDRKLNAIVFPVRDINGKLSYLTKRAVDSKKFYIDSGADKSNIYLLHEAKKCRKVYVCESQINALTLWSWGYPAIAMIGCGTSKDQMNTLNKTDIRHYVLCYDPDDAGRKGTKRFLEMIKKSALVDVVELPKGKDVNDLSKEEFEGILNGN